MLHNDDAGRKLALDLRLHRLKRLVGGLSDLFALVAVSRGLLLNALTLGLVGLTVSLDLRGLLLIQLFSLIFLHTFYLGALSLTWVAFMHLRIPCKLGKATFRDPTRQILPYNVRHFDSGFFCK